MKKIAILCSECPYPISKGSHSRMDAMIRAIRRLGNEIYLCVLKTARDGRTVAETQRQLQETYSATRVVVVNHPHFFSKKGTRARTIRDFILRRRKTSIRETISNRHTCPVKFRKAVDALFREIDPDVAFVNYAKLAMAVPASFAGLRVLDTHDVQHLLEESLAQSGKEQEFSLIKMKAHEKRLLSQFDRLVAINRNEHAYLKRFLQPARKPIYTVPAFQATEDIVLGAEEMKYDFLFVGSSATFNRDGFLKFEEEVLAALHQRYPDMKVAVVGSVCDTAAIKKLRKKYLHRLGYVDDLSTIYDQSKIVVVPIMAGAGMKIKLIEALAHGKAVVSTSLGADGVDIESGLSGYITDDWSEFRDHCERLLDDDELRQNIESGALELYLRNHHVSGNLETIGEILKTDFERVSERSPIPSSASDASEPLGLIFTPDARHLVDINLALGRALRAAGSRVNFLKFEKTGYSIFHKNGFEVTSINEFDRKAYRARAEAALKSSVLRIGADDRVIYRGFDLTEDFEFHRAAFPNHFKAFNNTVLHSISLLMMVEDLIARLRPDYLVGWNGNGPHLMYILKIAGIIHSLPVIHTERGLLPNTFVADAKGVNFKGHLAGSKLPLISSRQAAQLEKQIEKYRSSKQTIVSQGTTGSKAEVLAALGIAQDDNYVFFPEQIEIDSNVIINSPQYKTMHAVMTDICAAAKQFGLTVVVRPHPENTGQQDRTSAEMTKAYGCPVVVSKDIHVHSLIEHAKCVVTINSTVGLEALLFNKPVIALGNATYSFKGMTFDARSRQDIELAIASIVEGRDDATSRRMKVVRFRSMLEDYLFDLDNRLGQKRNIARARNLLGQIGVDVPRRVVTKVELPAPKPHWQEYQKIASSTGDDRFGIMFLVEGTARYLTGPNRPAISLETLREEAPNLTKKANFVLTSIKDLPDEDVEAMLIYCRESEYAENKYKHMLNKAQKLIFLDEFFEPFATMKA
ncbi:capsular polysaccharide export protein, LipB/KpsS family [Sinorhizobium sojae]|nr:glycosyltransferase [Sinorhizobium sojae]